MSNSTGSHRIDFNGSNNWQQAKAPQFWGTIAACDHVVQIYEEDEILINALAGFVGDGINAGDVCVIIATNEHIAALNKKLKEHGLYVEALIADNRYVPLDAEETLSKFMIDEWPDAPLFFLTVSEALAPLKENGRRVRAFGEMVALLWNRGNKDATLHLEKLWNKFCETEPLSLFCAYPRSAFDGDSRHSILNICCTHSMIISGADNQMSEVLYRTLDHNRSEANN